MLAPVLIWKNNASVRIFNLRRETRNSSVAQITAQVGPFLSLCDLHTSEKKINSGKHEIK